MTIVFDMRWAGIPGSEAGAYSRELASRLHFLSPGDRFLYLFRDAATCADVMDGPGPSRFPNAYGEVFPHAPDSPAGQLLLPILLRVRHCELFLSPAPVIPILAYSGSRRTSAGRCIVAVHDAAPFLAAGNGARHRPHSPSGIRAAISRATAVLAPSEAVCGDLGSALSLPAAAAAKFHVVHDGAPAVPAGFRPGSAASPRSPLVLYAGSLEPHKQVPELVHAFAEVLHRGFGNARLAIVAQDDPRHPEARRMAESLGIADHVVFPGPMSGAELADLYREAAVVVNPSRYEESGAPLLAAMAHGAPVVCTDGGAQPEIAGDAARIVPAGALAALPGAILDVLGDPALRAGLVRRGLARAAGFSWDAAARATLSACRVVARRGSTLLRVNQAGRPRGPAGGRRP